ncbi:MAG TPA: TadE family protein [Pirellulales bacterium]|nr:TadE family protein [Pirellulales bacterium]
MQPRKMAIRHSHSGAVPQRQSVGGLHKDRRGAALVEFALTASLLFLIVLTAVEFMRVNTIVNTSENAAYEGARTGIVPGATAADAIAAAQSTLNVIGTRNAVVSVEPETITSDTEEITVTVQVPLDDNSFIAPRFFLGKTLTKACTLSREVVSAAPSAGS